MAEGGEPFAEPALAGWLNSCLARALPGVSL